MQKVPVKGLKITNFDDLGHKFEHKLFNGSKIHFTVIKFYCSA